MLKVKKEEMDSLCRIQERQGFSILSRWYASLPLLITLKIRADDLGDVFQMIEENELGEDFAERLEPDVREKFLEMLKRIGEKCLMSKDR